MQNQNSPDTPVSSAYMQYQQQRMMRQEQQAAQAQQAILSSGADSFSQKAMDTIQQLRQISVDLANAQKQLEAQISAQQRQFQLMQQNIEKVCSQLQNTFKPGSAIGPGAMLQ